LSGSLWCVCFLFFLSSSLDVWLQSDDGTELYWLSSDGVRSGLFTGSTADNSATMRLDLAALVVPSLQPSALAVSEHFGFVIWVDRPQNSVYRVELPSLNVSVLSFPIGAQQLVDATIDSGSGGVFVSLWEGNNTRIALLSPDMSGLSATLYFKRGTPCCGMIQSFAVQTPLAGLLCPAGTYTATCIPCTNGTFASAPLSKSCPGDGCL
jgi:hypothetical protein